MSGESSIINISDESVQVALKWFNTYSNKEKLEIETLFNMLTRAENIQLRMNLASIFTLEDDKWSMLDILCGVDVLENTIKICLRSITNGNNLENQILKNIPFECCKYAFLIAKRQLTLYGRIESCKNKSFYKDSSYKSIYTFCNVFSVSQKMTIFLKNNLNIKEINEWLSFDNTSNTRMIEALQCQGIKSFNDLCLLISNKDSYQKLIFCVQNNKSLENDVRLEFKIIQLRKIITLLEKKWKYIQF